MSIKSFRGGNRGMDRDMQNALHAEQHPDIVYVLKGLQSAEVCSDPSSHQPAVRLEVLGELSVAGVQRDTVTVAIIHRDARGHYIVHAEQPMLMSDFEVKPPSALFGLIEAHNEMTVAFDLDFAPPAPER